MKKLFILSLILLSLTLVGCSQNNLSQDELFEKKQECNLYNDIANEYIEKYINHSSYRINLIKIFYSSTKNSCVAAFETILNTSSQAIVGYDIYDLLSLEKIMIGGTEETFKDTLKELKGE